MEEEDERSAQLLLEALFFFLVTASVFAEDMGFVAEDLTTGKSRSIFSQWLKSNCQPNYRKVSEWVEECFSLPSVVGSSHAASRRETLSVGENKPFTGSVYVSS